MVSTVVVGWGRWKYGRSSPIESLGSSNCKRGAVRRYLLGANAIGGRLAVELKILFVAAESMVLQTKCSFASHHLLQPSPASIKPVANAASSSPSSPMWVCSNTSHYQPSITLLLNCQNFLTPFIPNTSSLVSCNVAHPCYTGTLNRFFFNESAVHRRSNGCRCFVKNPGQLSDWTKTVPVHSS